MNRERIYLDHAAGSSLGLRVRTEMDRVLGWSGAAPSGGHREGREAREELTKARGRLADFLGAKNADSVVFTSGGTEAVQSGMRGWGEAVGKGTIYLSEMEHPAVESAARQLEKRGFGLVRIPVDGEGKFRWEEVKGLSGEGLVCVHLAHHDLGTVQNLSEAKRFAEQTGAKLFLDGTHGAGWVSLDVEKVGADMVALSGHRLGGPKGVGALWQEGDRRAGTENLPAIVGFGVAAEEWRKDGEERRKQVGKAQKILADGILTKVHTAKLHGTKLGAERSPAHLAFSFKGLEAESLALVLDRVGLAVRGGSGCVTREMKIPPGMKAIGAEEGEARALILFTLGLNSQAEQMEEAATRVAEGVDRLTKALPGSRE